LNKLWIYTQPLIYFGMLLNFLKPFEFEIEINSKEDKVRMNVRRK